MSISASKFAPAPDGYVSKNGTTWSATRDAGTGTSAGPNSTNRASAVMAYHTAGRGGDSFTVSRAFFSFDTSKFKTAPSSARLLIYGRLNGDADIIAVKATAPDLSTDIAVADFDAITGFSAGNSMNGNVTDYSSEVTTWSTSGYNSIVVNAAALADIASLDAFAVALVQYDNDYLNVAPSEVNLNSGMYFNEGGSGTAPILEIVYGNSINGVAFGDLGNVMDVDEQLANVSDA